MLFLHLLSRNLRLHLILITKPQQYFMPKKFLIQSKNDCEKLDNLKAILDANEFSSDFNFFIGPRKSTISPWSSKTQDIVQNVGIKNIFRIEKFIGFDLENINEKNDLNFDTLFDRMTQSLFSEEEIKSFFQKQPQRQLNIINVIENGQAALMAANEEFGLLYPQQK